jgi:hypothetical protein
MESVLQGMASTAVSCREATNFEIYLIWRHGTPHKPLNWTELSVRQTQQQFPMGDSITSNLVDSFRCPIMKLRGTRHKIACLYPLYSVSTNEHQDEHSVPRLRSLTWPILVSY